MKTTEWKWNSSDGLDMYSKAWLPDGSAKGAVCLVHGVSEHIGRYQAVGKALTEAGYILAGFDLRGFGRSGGVRGHTPNLETYFDDIDSFLAEITRRFPDMPRSLYGHSMGGLLVLAYTPVRKPKVLGVIATAPGLKTLVEKQRTRTFLIRMLAKILPSLGIKYQIDRQTLSRDPSVATEHSQDPLIYPVITPAWGVAMLEAIRLADDNAVDFPVPLLLMHGTRDEIAYPSGSLEYSRQIPEELLTLKIWEGFKHELHNEPEKAQVFQEMVEWLGKQLINR